MIIVGASGVGAALLLSGLQRPIIRLLEGYPLERVQRAPLLGQIYRWRLARWQHKFDQLTRALDGEASKERTKAALRLNDSFPARRESLLPSEFGNVLRAFETHPRRRYGLDGIAIWPLIGMLLSETERAEVEEARTDLHFFVNLTIVSALAGLLVTADIACHASSAPSGIAQGAAAVTVAVAVSALFWRASIGAGRGWGRPVRASFDLHRLELYRRLGVRSPATTSDDEVVGRAVNRLLSFGEPIPDECRVDTREGGEV